MSEQYIIISASICFFGLFLAGILALFPRTLQKAGWLFVIANVMGFFSGFLYFLYFFGQKILFFQTNWFFGFRPEIDLLSAIFFTVVSFASASVGVYSNKYLEIYNKTYNKGLVQSLTAFFVFGMLGVFLSNNVFSFLFFWELMSITSFFLVMSDREKDSLKAAFLYFIMTHLGASAIFGGFLILGKGSLSFELADIYVNSQSLSPFLASLSFLLLFFGFGSKAGLAPFHVWLPEAHPQAPSNISAMMSGLMLKVAVYGFIKIIFVIFLLPSWAGGLVFLLGIFSIAVGVLYAVIEKDIKRAFAFSSIENMGIIFSMLGLALHIMTQYKEAGYLAGLILMFAILHAINHAFFKTALFLSSGVIINRTHTRSMDSMGGIAKAMPFFSFVFLLAVLGSLPLPPFGTFYGEWGMIQNIIILMRDFHFEVWTLAMLVLALLALGWAGGLAVFAMVKIFGITMLGLSKKHFEEYAEKKDYALILPIFGLMLVVILLGIFAKPIIGTLAGEIILKITMSKEVPVLTNQFSPPLLFASFVFFGVIIIVIKNLLVSKQTERKYKTWDCGQSINSSMEYTSSAFSAPIRYFFSAILNKNKIFRSTAILESNPWIRRYEFFLKWNSPWKDIVYRRIAEVLVFWAEKIKIIQGGRIQFYLLFLLITLIITLMLAL